MLSVLRRSERYVALALALLASALFVWLARAVAWPVVDDAGISLAFGRSLLAGDGPRLTAASQPVEGFSSALWALLQGLSLPLGLDGVRFSAWLGMASGALAAALTAALGPVAAGRPLRVDDAVAPWLVATNPTAAAWASSGMETGLWMLALVATALVVLRASRTGRGPLGAGVLLGALVLVRPEAPAYVLAAAGAWGLAARRAGRPVLREAAPVALAVLVTGALLLLLRWVCFADWLPNTYWAKRLWTFDGPASVASFGRTYAWLTGAAVAGGLLGSLLRRGARAPQAALFLAWAGAAGVFALEGDWMSEWRFLAPSIPLLAAAVSSGLNAVRSELEHAGGALPRRLGLAAVGALLLAGAICAGLAQWARRDAVRAAPQFPMSLVADTYRGIAGDLSFAGERRPLLAIPDAGGSPAVLPHAELVDVAGLCDRAVARHAGNHAALEDYLVSEGPPSLVDAHGPSGHLRDYKRLHEHLAYWRGTWWRLRGLSAESDPRCPGGKGAVLALSAAELVAALEVDLETQDGQTALRRWRCAFAYQPEERLPDARARRRLAEAAWWRSVELEARGALEPSLRLASFATVISDHRPAYRRRTEALRERLFPRPAPARR